VADTLTTRPPATGPGEPTPGGPARAAAATLWLPWSLTAVAAILVLLDVSAPVLRPVAGLFLAFVVPTWVLARRLRWPFETRVHAGVVALGLTIFGLLAGGLLLNTVLPRLGVDRPLDHGPVSVTLVVADLALLAWRARVPLLDVGPGVLAERLTTLQWRLVPTLAVLSVGLSVVGAVRLNNDAGGAVALLAHVLVVVLLGAAMFARGGGLNRDVAAVYAAGVSLLLGTSLRSWYVSGHDVQRELISFRLTDEAGRWVMDAYPNAYHACLSVNILPTVLAQTSDLSGAVLFKLVTQLVAAVVPVVVYLLARTILERRLALASVAVFVGFPTFSGDLSYLTRQEYAFLFLGLAFLVATQLGLSLRLRRGLVTTMGLGVVLSHYSTTYMMIATCLIGLGVLVGLEWWERRRARADGDRPRPDREPMVLLHPVVIGVLLAATVAWVGPVTHSGGHVLDTASDSLSDLLAGRSVTGSSDLSYSILPGQQTSDSERLDQFADYVIKQREDRPDLPFLLPVTDSMEHPVAVTIAKDPLTGVGRVVQHVVPVEATNALLRAALAAVLQVLLIGGLAALVLRRARGCADVPDQTRALMVGALGGVAMVVLVPGLSAEYGVLRALQQGFVLLAPVVIIGAVTLVGLVKPLARHATRLVTGGVLGLVLVLTGVVSTVTGGYTGVLALSNTGPYHEIHYVTAPEVAGYRWLGLNAGGRIVQGEVLSDKLAANRLVWNPSGVYVAADMYPASLLAQSAVFLGPDTVHHGYAVEFYGGTAVAYEYPTAKLARHLDVVFSSPDAQIYWPESPQ
jgi:uncharacterized membrane protein